MRRQRPQPQRQHPPLNPPDTPGKERVRAKRWRTGHHPQPLPPEPTKPPTTRGLKSRISAGGYIQEERRVEKLASSLVVYMAEGIDIARGLRMGRRIFHTTEYDWGREARGTFLTGERIGGGAFPLASIFGGEILFNFPPALIEFFHQREFLGEGFLQFPTSASFLPGLQSGPSG
ncbi:hypothetical protein BGX38DRAFT_228797 [Terfezia claveryi]|nr:hypothetical protein BGX38DRAFT_228797 [Terfezia claveryi]